MWRPICQINQNHRPRLTGARSAGNASAQVDAIIKATSSLTDVRDGRHSATMQGGRRRRRLASVSMPTST